MHIGVRVGFHHVPKIRRYPALQRSDTAIFPVVGRSLKIRPLGKPIISIGPLGNARGKSQRCNHHQMEKKEATRIYRKDGRLQWTRRLATPTTIIPMARHDGQSPKAINISCYFSSPLKKVESHFPMRFLLQLITSLVCFSSTFTLRPLSSVIRCQYLHWPLLC
jgi:hypothetical protein